MRPIRGVIQRLDRIWPGARGSKHHLSNGFWAVMDQGLFATSNFAMNILLARWLTPEGYGAFGLAFAIFLFIGNLQQAALLEPMLVFGPGRYKSRSAEYLGVLVYGHFALTALGSLTLLLAGLGLALWGSAALSTVMLALAVTGPFILFPWLMRRACYALLKPRLAAWGSAWYMALMLAGAYALYRSEYLSAASALGVMGVSSLLVGLWLATRLGVKLPPLSDDGLVRDSFRSHWKYGRWSLTNQALNWLPLNISYVILPIWGGLAAGASFRALMNLIMPVMQGVWAMSTVLLPALVRARTAGRGVLAARVRSATALFVLGSAAYWLLLGLLHRPLVSWLYGGQYTEHAGLLWLLGLCPVLVSAKLVLGNSLRAIERPDRLFWAHVLPAATALTLGTALVYSKGIAGAGMLMLVSQAIAVVMTVVSYRRLLHSPETTPHPRGDSPKEERRTV